MSTHPVNLGIGRVSYVKSCVANFSKFVLFCRFYDRFNNQFFKIRNQAFKIRIQAFQIRNQAFKIRIQAFQIRNHAFKLRVQAFKIRNHVSARIEPTISDVRRSSYCAIIVLIPTSLPCLPPAQAEEIP